MLTDLFYTLTAVTTYTVVVAAIGYVVGQDRERAAHETRIVPLDDHGLDRLLVDGGSLSEARRARMRRVK